MNTQDDTIAWLEEHHAKQAVCKIEDCTNPAVQKLGPYGGLCDEHRTVLIEERKAARNGQVEQPQAKKRELTLAELATQIEETHQQLATLTSQMRERLDRL